MVENIGVLVCMFIFMVDLFVNYDCDEDRVDLCEDMIGLLLRNVFLDLVIWSMISVLFFCLDVLFCFI